MLKRTAVIFAMVLAMVIGAKADKWVFDHVHSDVGFQVKHLVISNVRGNFAEYDGHVMFDGKNWDKASVEVTVQMASIDTDNEKRDEHLRSGDFFEVEKYPTMTFKSTKVMAADDDGKFKFMGDLTVKGVTKQVTFDAELQGVVTGPMGKTRAGFSATTTINRQDFNVKWANKLQDGTIVVGDDVKINIELQVIKADS